MMSDGWQTWGYHFVKGVSHHDIDFVHLKLIVIVFKKLDISIPSPGLFHFHVTADFSDLATQLLFLFVLCGTWMPGFGALFQAQWCCSWDVCQKKQRFRKGGLTAHRRERFFKVSSFFFLCVLVAFHFFLLPLPT